MTSSRWPPIALRRMVEPGKPTEAAREVVVSPELMTDVAFQSGNPERVRSSPETHRARRQLPRLVDSWTGDLGEQ